MQPYSLTNLGTIYSTETHNYNFGQTGSSTSSSTSNKDVSTTSTTTSETTYTPGILERLGGLFNKNKHEEQAAPVQHHEEPVNELQHLLTSYHSGSSNYDMSQTGSSTNSGSRNQDVSTQQH